MLQDAARNPNNTSAFGTLIHIKNDKPRLLRQQSRRRGNRRLCLIPLRAVFSDSIRRAVGLAGEQRLRCVHLVRVLGRLSPTRKTIIIV
jgi:hypothetical protein